ncbi:MAG: hypothetical protein RBR66_04000, partial [Candidatus Izemoplasmatales bacterium]|nr:hypothetical protein [Candidatus Izemoplasmatales bacterium]
MHAEIKKLEFDKILKTLENFAHTTLAKRDVLTIFPMTNSIEIEQKLLEVEEAKITITRYDQTPLTGVLDITEIIKKSEIGSTLSIEEILKIVSHAEAVSRTLLFVKKVDSLEINF